MWSLPMSRSKDEPTSLPWFLGEKIPTGPTLTNTVWIRLRFSEFVGVLIEFADKASPE